MAGWSQPKLARYCCSVSKEEEYPTYKRAYIRAFDKMLDVRKSERLADGVENWRRGVRVVG